MNLLARFPGSVTILPNSPRSHYGPVRVTRTRPNGLHVGVRLPPVLKYACVEVQVPHVKFTHRHRMVAISASLGGVSVNESSYQPKDKWL